MHLPARLRSLLSFLLLVALVIVPSIRTSDAQRAVPTNLSWVDITSVGKGMVERLAHGVYPSPITFATSATTTAVVPANAIVAVHYSMVWAFTRGDATSERWTHLAGTSLLNESVSAYLPSPYARFARFPRSTFDYISNIFYLSLTTLDADESTPTASIVSRSVDGGATWSIVANSSLPGSLPAPGPILHLVASTTTGTLFAVRRNDSSLTLFMQRSCDQGSTWTAPTNNTVAAPLGSNSILAVAPSRLTAVPTDVIMLVRVLSAEPPSLLMSADYGATFVAVTFPFAYQYMDLYWGFATTRDGLVVGFGIREPGDGWSGAWVSADGGRTWGRCEAANVARRTSPQVFFDSDGYMWVAMRDYILPPVMRSTISFHDLHAVSLACNVSIPVKGPGVQCWPPNATDCTYAVMNFSSSSGSTGGSTSASGFAWTSSSGSTRGATSFGSSVPVGGATSNACSGSSSGTSTGGDGGYSGAAQVSAAVFKFSGVGRGFALVWRVVMVVAAAIVLSLVIA